jgi:hypothetical protein
VSPLFALFSLKKLRDITNSVDLSPLIPGDRCHRSPRCRPTCRSGRRGQLLWDLPHPTFFDYKMKRVLEKLAGCTDEHPAASTSFTVMGRHPKPNSSPPHHHATTTVSPRCREVARRAPCTPLTLEPPLLLHLAPPPPPTITTAPRCLICCWPSRHCGNPKRSDRNRPARHQLGQPPLGPSQPFHPRVCHRPPAPKAMACGLESARATGFHFSKFFYHLNFHKIV